MHSWTTVATTSYKTKQHNHINYVELLTPEFETLFEIPIQLFSLELRENNSHQSLLSNVKAEYMSLAATLATGDYRSKGVGPVAWSLASSWEIWDGFNWGPATAYPGQNVQAPFPTVTIQETHTITIASNLTTPNEIGELQIFGTLVFGDNTSTQHDIEIKTSLVTIESTGILNFDGVKIKLTLPNSLAVVAIESGGNITGSCTNNDEIYIGVKKFAVCAGAGAGGTFTFGELVATGGNINSIITTPDTTPITVCSGELVSIQGKYASSGGVTNVTYAWVVRDPSNNPIVLSSGLNTGSLATLAALTTPATFTPTITGTYLVSLKVTTTTAPIITNIETNIVTVIPNKTVTTASSAPTLCISTALTPITHTTTGATGIGAATGLPAGLTAAFAANTITISGTPTASGTFNYTVPVTGCGTVNATGTITVGDTILPVITCPIVTNVTKNTGAGVCTYTASGTEFNAIATDNCVVPALSYTLSGATSGTGTSLAGVNFNKGVTTVTWSATDGVNAAVTCGFTVTVIDVTPPTVVCQNISVNLDASGNATITPAQIDNGS